MTDLKRPPRRMNFGRTKRLTSALRAKLDNLVYDESDLFEKKDAACIRAYFKRIGMDCQQVSEGRKVRIWRIK